MATFERHTTVLKDRDSNKDDGVGLVLALFMLAIAALGFYLWAHQAPRTEGPTQITVNMPDVMLAAAPASSQASK